jgi:hypothetical protein
MLWHPEVFKFMKKLGFKQFPDSRIECCEAAARNSNKLKSILSMLAMILMKGNLQTSYCSPWVALVFYERTSIAHGYIRQQRTF